MKNVGDCASEERSAAILDELAPLGVRVLGGREPPHGELGPFKFERRWYCWTITGPVPLAAAREMYADPVGRRDVRVAGHRGCPPPEEWVEDFGQGPVVTSYDVDSAAGLWLFVETIRRHGLASEEATP